MSNNPVLDALVKARELYAANPSHVPPSDMPNPGTYCPVTALCEAANVHPDNSKGLELSWTAEDRLMEAAGVSLIAPWNAEHTTEEVLAAFDRAIEAERARG